MKRLNRNLLAAATATALGVGGAGAAQAAMMGVKAFSHLAIDNFQIFNSDGEQYQDSDFDSLDIDNTSSTFADTDVHGVTSSRTLDTTSGGGNPDDNLSCVGACGGIVDDDFMQQGEPASGNSFARGDTLLQGALIDGLTGLSNSVSADALSEAQADDIEDTGEGNSSVGTGTEFSFNLANDGETITFEFEGTPFLEAMLESDFGSAFASLNFSISIADEEGDQVFSYEPADLNESRSRLSAGTAEYNPGSGLFSATTDPLDGDVNYTLSIDHRSRVTFESEVAAPATLGLFGLGLLALGWMTRRRQARAA